jgi:2-oxoglutarate ferredoxin oxidoreductase subunit alpha
MDRLARKYETAREWVPQPELTGGPVADIGIIAFGSSHTPVLEAMDQLSADGIRTAYLRIRALPFHRSVQEFVALHPRVYVVEQNRDAQMLKLLKADLPAELCTRLRSVLHYDGLPVYADAIHEGIKRMEVPQRVVSGEKGPGTRGEE